MTKKKQSEEVQAENAQVMKEAFAMGAQLELCGHINKQFINKNGKQEDLACTLPKGHGGDHFALIEHVVTDYGIDSDNHQVPVGQHIEMSDGWWSDAAGVFPNPVVVSQEEDFSRLKASRDRERSKNGVQSDDQLSKKVDGEVIQAFHG